MPGLSFFNMATAFERESLRGDLRHGHRDRVVNKPGTILNRAYISVWHAMGGVDIVHARHGIGQREKLGRVETQKLKMHFLVSHLYRNPHESPIHTTTSLTVNKNIDANKDMGDLP